MKKFSYRTILAVNAIKVFEYYNLGIQNEVGPQTTKRIKSLLDDGYRWIRTDGNFAIFEKEVA